MVSPKWTDPADDDKCRAWARAMAGKFTEERERAAREGQDGGVAMEGVGQYANYDGLMDEKGSQIFGRSYERLAVLKGRYDPENRFSKGHL